MDATIGTHRSTGATISVVSRSIVPDLLLGAFLLAGALTVYWRSSIITSFDSGWSIYLSMNILRQGRADLDVYETLIDPRDYRIEKVDGHYYSYFPLGVSIIAVPFLWVRDYVSISDLFSHLKAVKPSAMDELTTKTEMHIASFIAALTVTLMYLITRQFFGPMASFLVASLFAFGTSAWSTASRGLWQHGPSILFLALTLYIVLLARKRPWLIQLGGFSVACSYLMRPTNSISVVLLTLYVLIQHRRYFLGYLAASMVVAIPFVLYNESIYHAFLPSYYRPTRLGEVPLYAPANLRGAPYFAEALLGNLLSPARGLFIFSPIFALSLAGMFIGLSKPAPDRLDYFLIVIVILHWISISAYWHWWGGTSFGPRFFTDMLPYLTFFLTRFFAVIPDLRVRYRLMIIPLLSASVLISIAINGAGSTRAGGYEWNWGRYSIDAYPERIWDWNDPQFLRALQDLADSRARSTLIVYP